MAARSELPTVLFVDDEDDDFFLISRLLKKAGLKNPISRFSNGTDAIHFLQGAEKSGKLPSAIFLDINMPGLNGFDVLAWIRSQRRLESCPVIMLSTSNDERDIKRATQLGANQYLRKYPSSEALSDLLSHLGSRAA